MPRGAPRSLGEWPLPPLTRGEGALEINAAAALAALSAAGGPAPNARQRVGVRLQPRGGAAADEEGRAFPAACGRAVVRWRVFEPTGQRGQPTKLLADGRLPTTLDFAL